MKKNTRLLLLCLLIIAGTKLFAQEKRGQALIDSLDAILPSLAEDTNKAKVLNRIAQTYEAISPVRSFPYVNRGLALAEKLHWKKGIANYNNNLGLYISDTGNSALARVYLEKSLALNQEMGSKAMEVGNLINIGRTFSLESDFTHSNAYLFRALAIAEEIKDNDKIAFIGGNLASSYFSQNNLSKATEYAEMELKYGTLAGKTHHVSKAYQLLSGVRHMLKDTAGSIGYLEKAVKICEENNDEVGKADALLNLALEYADYKKGIAIMLRVDTLMEKINRNSEINLANMGNLGNAYNQLAKTSASPDKEVYMRKAEAYLLKAKNLAEQNTSPEYQAHMYYMLSDLEEHKTNYKAALDYYKKAAITNDSLFSQEKKNEIAGLEGKHNMALKDAEIALNQLTVASQRKTLWGLILGLALLLIAGSFIYRQSRNRKKTNTTLMVLNNQLDEANKVKARLFGILSHDLRSPIASLINFLTVLKNEPELLNAGERAAHQQQIGQSAENLLQTMETMLVWSKDQMDNFKPDILTVPVQNLFDYIQKFFAHNSQARMRFSDPGDLTVSADENYLKIIMQNLTANAIKAVHNRPDGIIEWEAKNMGSRTILSVTDNGPGIGMEQVNTLFDDRVANNEKHGFGLHLIRDLAKAIQYKIAVESEPGRGTKFILSYVAA